jgi:magnesium transporter
MTQANRRRHRKNQARIRRRTPPGAAPGLLTPVPGSPQPAIRVMAYGEHEFLERKIQNVDELGDLKSRYAVIWVDVEGLGDAGVVAALGKVFGLHMLALEDVVNTHQRAKVDEYGEHLFVIARMVRLTDGLETEQLSLFAGPGFVLSFQDQPGGDCLDPVRERIRKGQGRVRQAGADYLAYALLDAVVDGYFPVLEQYAERLETLDVQVTESDPRETMHRIHDMRSDLLMLRRAIWPHRETLNALARDPHPLVTQETRLHLRDCLDHIVAIIDLTETYREMCSDLRDYYLATVSNRTNEIMKVLTVIATIFMPLTFIAGLYGMNFATDASPWNMPELRWHLGYPFALALMAAVAGWMLLYFRRKGWLGYSLPPPGTGNTHQDAGRENTPAIGIGRSTPPR